MMKHLIASVCIKAKEIIQDSFFSSFLKVIAACDCVKKLIIQEEFCYRTKIMKRKEMFQKCWNFFEMEWLRVFHLPLHLLVRSLSLSFIHCCSSRIEEDQQTMEYVCLFKNFRLTICVYCLKAIKIAKFMKKKKKFNSSRFIEIFQNHAKHHFIFQLFCWIDFF